MIQLNPNGVYFVNADTFTESLDEAKKLAGREDFDREAARKNTIAYGILSEHNISKDDTRLNIRFDCMASHDITYVGIIQTARASGLKEFPVPYVLTNCHNSLCAVGGTINEDDHMFGLSAAKKYGGIYVPAHQAVIHSFMREMMSGCGKMILGSDSHTRYGALGTLAIGEGGPELVKQLLCRTYDITRPEVVGVYLSGAPKSGVGPQDVALAIIGAVFKNGFVKNKIMEFIGPGIANLPIEFRNGIDVMTTETTCLSSVWMTDEKTKAYFENHKRPEAYRRMCPGDVAYYDSLIRVDFSKIESMIALPFHPSNVYSIKTLNENLSDIINKVESDAKEQLGKKGADFSLHDKIHSGRLFADQGVIAGCAGGIFDNLCAAADIVATSKSGCGEFSLSAYPASQPAFLELMKNGCAQTLMSAGVTLRSAFCGPCFGAGDVPANRGFSIRHSTRNFPNREGSKPGDGQIASVALMDARSIAATAISGGKITPATELDPEIFKTYPYHFDDTVYRNKVYFGYGKAEPSHALQFGPNIADWPEQIALCDHVLLQMASVITDPVTTTDELIPSGETSSYRSNPLRLSEFTLSRKDPEYVGRAKAIRALEQARRNGDSSAVDAVLQKAAALWGNPVSAQKVGIGSVIFAVKPGDGSAREQAASCQRVLGGLANIAVEYATKRYRSNLINWGMLPFLISENPGFVCGDFIFVPNIRKALLQKESQTEAYLIHADGSSLTITLEIPPLTEDERDIIAEGCLINYYNRK